jgi:hypothetical protein
VTFRVKAARPYLRVRTSGGTSRAVRRIRMAARTVRRPGGEAQAAAAVDPPASGYP